ncbi:holin-associated N-acetylmuramidase [Phaeobacter gallaeciensis]|uniref:holin-associated N-acetylmuramidase n=1 Tax=Phaeobacter gallaeciensis TaxID=60890 RepID=UPI00237F07A8|nr:holin-associated N-acetylmuramidase [Phaeobacter gallaeciensis]MDE4189956.1 holin-associated N-acetylmuramidase [Phaeobacter gallaeciensis]MDE4199109.1 holin-associated N-acetylmuramidase [Phaeobacter gallaeciensis]MDE4203257.1 holin-associated N-acetylmuramidase [Phaeobacter gallaeciensis]MDE4207399.1 holin-associated N-acetylmuramidase [Phaeobacter gallaeciensis]MDE4215377.1 holin-associated N-acetylmuramidase [Phaeobacter gallaeciensis]
MQVRQIAEEIVEREGGYVNDPGDPGGATKHGVTIGTLKRLGIDVTGDGQVDTRDVKALSHEEAVDIFIRWYFERPGIARLPEALQASVFDMYVNSGANAVRILQGLLREMGFDLAVDGVIGPHTAAAAQRAAQVDAKSLRDAYGIARRSYYFDLADRRPASRKYARTRAGGKGGWIRRAEVFISTKYHMDRQAFVRRVARWQEEKR